MSTPHVAPRFRHGIYRQLGLGDATARFTLYDATGEKCGMVEIVLARENEDAHLAIEMLQRAIDRPVLALIPTDDGVHRR